MEFFDSQHRRRGGTNLSPGGYVPLTAEVLDSAGDGFTITNIALNSSRNGFALSATALDSDGNPFTIFT